MILRRTQSCEHCGKEIGHNARFCPHCGQPTAAAGVNCPHCGEPAAANARFCGRCGRELSARRDPDVRGSVWRMSPDEFAVRIEPQDLSGRIYKEVEIQPGQLAVLLVDGRATEERRGPGRYTVQSLFDRLLNPGQGRHVTALVMRSDAVPLEFTLSGLYTNDAYELNGRVILTTRVQQPTHFVANVMQGRQNFTVADLRGLLFDQVRDAAQDVLRRLEFKRIPQGLTMKGQVGNAIEMHLGQVFTDSGMQFGEVRTVDFAHPRFDALRRQWEDIRLNREEIEADTTRTEEQRQGELERRRRLFDVDLAEESQETREQRERVRVFEERAQVWERARQAMFLERANAIRSEEDFADFMAEIDEGKLLRQEQIEELQEAWAARKEDRIAARAQVAYLAELERDYARKQAELARRSDFTIEQMAAGLRVEQQKLADAGVLTEARWDLEMKELFRQADREAWQRAELQKREIFERQRESDAAAHRRELQMAQVMHALEIDAIVADADLTEAEKRAKMDVELTRYRQQRTDIERQITQADFNERLRQEQQMANERARIEALEDEQDRKTVTWATEAMLNLKRGKAAIADEERRSAREDDLTRADAAHRQELERKEQALREAAQAQAHDLALLQARADMSAEALISLSAPEQAKVIAELKSTEALKGLSDDAIFAMMAKDSAPLAAALAEKFKAMQAQPELAEQQLAEVKKLYDQMVAELQKDKDRQADLNERTQQRLQQMYEKGLDSQREGMVDIARATSHAPAQAPGPTIITTSGGGPGYGPQPTIITPGGGPLGSGSGEVQVCPKCRVKSPIGEKYCSNCGHQFFE